MALSKDNSTTLVETLTGGELGATQQSPTNHDPLMIGVDFSGARSDKATAVALGYLQGADLIVTDCCYTSRSDLFTLLQNAPPGSIAALDFPFSVPRSFARVLTGCPKHMDDLWDAVACMEMEEFIALRDGYVADHGEPKRECDLEHPEAYSVLHKVNPNMLPMTLRGMQLLRALRRRGIAILALDPPLPEGLTIIECMPGASLKGLRLPYKGYKNGRDRTRLRKVILEGLSNACPVKIANIEDVWNQCETSHDCLDSVGAALTAATYELHPESVSTPPDREIFRLEGWIYALTSPI